ncbi:MAG TPA: T9SS type A sorting domain-containing protein, partial [Bacteroidia bacterium]|nr:T9SS type A sorting domain-containing protein [Bacteroidia bacterium]
TSGPSLLMIGGAFTSSAKLSLKYLALWNGIKLDSIRRTKFDNSYIHTVPDNTVHALISDYYQDIDIGGIFSNAGSGPYLKYAGFVQFDLTQWFTDADQTVLDSNGILAFANYGTDLMVAGNGYFTSGGKKQYIGYVNLTSPPQLQWTTMGSGVNNSVYCMANYNSDIYAGGAFDTAGGLRVGYIAAWNGSTWDSVITLNNHVQSMVANGSVLYIAGDFTSVAPVISKGRNPQSASYNHIVEFNSAPNGINTINSKSEARIFPNPSNGIFTLQMKLTSENASLEVYNVFGENIYSAPMQKGANTILLNLSQQPSGIYLYRIASEQGEYITSGKLIIE